MRLFRTSPVLVNGTAVVVLVSDVDGVAPVTLTLENMDIKASLSPNFGSKNARIRITAVASGVAANDKRIKIARITAGGTFAVAVDGDDMTITLAGSASAGSAAQHPTLTAAQVVDLLNADATFIAFGVVADVPPGSDGSAIFVPDGQIIANDILAFTNLAGGADATVMAILGTAVQHGPTVDGPWITHTGASTALGVALAAGAAVSYTITEPLRYIRVSLSKGAANTSAVVSCERSRAVI